MQKALTQMNVKLQHVISNITGRTGMDIIEAIVDGERDPRKHGEFQSSWHESRRSHDCQGVAGALAGGDIFELTQALELYRFYHEKIAECDWEIEAQLERLQRWRVFGSRWQKARPERTPLDIRTHLFRMTGVDLTRIDGIDGFTALKVVSEIGTT